MKNQCRKNFENKLKSREHRWKKTVEQNTNTNKTVVSEKLSRTYIKLWNRLQPIYICDSLAVSDLYHSDGLSCGVYSHNLSVSEIDSLNYSKYELWDRVIIL